MTGTQVAGATALVTGGQQGLGKAIVAALLEAGAAKVYSTAGARARPTIRAWW